MKARKWPNCWSNVKSRACDHKRRFFSKQTQLFIFEDNEAVIKMIIRRRSPMMRHVPRSHRVALNCLLDRINLDTKIQNKNVDTKNQLVDLSTDGNCTRDEWCNRLCSTHIMDLPMLSRSHFRSMEKATTISKRFQLKKMKKNLR